MLRSRSWTRVLLVASFLAVAAVQAWPLPVHLGTALTGEPGGDTGVYVWNQWVFRHELVEKHHSPFSTDRILALTGPVDLSLHNYTVFANLMAVPLQPLLGVVSTFNVVYLINVALCGIGMFLLARRVPATVQVGTAEAWLAGAVFACSPFLVARSTAHFSLAAAAALPFFLLNFCRAWHSGLTRDAALAGLCLAWAAFSDPYYAVYCVMLGASVMVSSALQVTQDRTRSPLPPGQTRRVIDAAIILLIGLVAGPRLFGLDTVNVGHIAVSMKSLYTPMLLLTVLVAIRAWLTWPLSVSWTWPQSLGQRIRGVLILGGVAALLIAPELYALTVRTLEGRMVSAPVLWRSSAPGLDLVSFFLPNPNHPLAPGALVNWVSAEPGRFEENVASIPWTVMLVLFAAWRLRAGRPDRLWLALAIGAAVLALGPFLRIAGLETFIPTPWALLRYAPVIGVARMPSRLAVIVILAVAVLFAHALAALRQRYRHQQWALLAIVGAALAAEMLPAPRSLHSARIPSIYDTVARDPRPVLVLSLPFGIRDGLSSLGNFSASSQFYQTRHGKALIGGYLSRVSQRSKDFDLQHPYLGALLTKSEGRILDDATRQAAAAAAEAFVIESRLGYVVIDVARTTPELRAFAITTMNLQLVARDGDVLLYVPSRTR